MNFDEERKIRMSERKRAVKTIIKFHDGSEGAFINMKHSIYEGEKP